MSTLGFALNTHSNPEQILRLVKRLSSMFADPPIACHHDFSSCALDTAAFPPNVHFVHPYVAARMPRDESAPRGGPFFIAEGITRAIRCLYNLPNPPKWFAVLSGADYPIRSAEAIERELSDSQYDVFLDWREINYNLYRTARPDGNKAHGSSEWLRVAYDRYIAVRIPYPALSHPFTKPAGGDIRIRHPFLLKPWQFFSDEFRCYGGEAWFTGNARAAEWLLAKNPRHDALKDFFQRRRCPEESYFQCIFCNAPHLAICNDDKRYIDWSEGGLHPRTLGLQDITKLSESSAHFARKFDQNWAVLDRIDAMIGPG